MAPTVGGSSSQWRVVLVSSTRINPSGRGKARCLSPLLQLATFTLGQTAPDAEPLIMCQGVLEALSTDVARQAHSLGLTCGSALLREERLGVRLSAKSALLPHEFFIELLRQTQIE